MVKVVASDEEFNKIMKGAGDKAIIVEFNASWCGPCQTISSTFAELAEKNSGSDKVIFLKVDVDECEETATTYVYGNWCNVSDENDVSNEECTVPAIIVFKNTKLEKKLLWKI